MISIHEIIKSSGINIKHKGNPGWVCSALITERLTYYIADGLGLPYERVILTYLHFLIEKYGLSNLLEKDKNYFRIGSLDDKLIMAKSIRFLLPPHNLIMKLRNNNIKQVSEYYCVPETLVITLIKDLVILGYDIQMTPEIAIIMFS